MATMLGSLRGRDASGPRIRSGGSASEIETSRRCAGRFWPTADRAVAVRHRESPLSGPLEAGLATIPPWRKPFGCGLARITRHEQAAEAARTIQTILAESHRRDREVAAAEASNRRGGTIPSPRLSSRGFMQPSAQKVDGRKLYVLIGKNGSTVAYLDIPPGLDPDPLVARRVGVRGVPHYNEDLHHA